MTDPNKKLSRNFQCREALWQKFEQMAKELECSVDYLINDAMKQYARQRGYASVATSLGPGATSMSSQAPGSTAPGSSPNAVTAPPAAPAPNMAPPPPINQGIHAPPPPTGNVPLPPPGASRAARPTPPPRKMGPPGPPPPPVAAHAGGSPAVHAPPPPPPPVAAHAAPPPPPPPGVAPPPRRGPPPLAPTRTLPPLPGGSGSQRAPAAGGALSIHYQGEVFPVNKERFIIGRGKQNSDLTIKDPNVSRQHAMIEFSNGQYYIVDMGSTNGVEFNGQRVQRRAITEGDIFKVCDHELRFSYQ